MLDESLIGKVGRVTEPILPGGELGEVMLEVMGSSQGYSAYTENYDKEIPRNARVVVVEHPSARTVLVTPY